MCRAHFVKRLEAHVVMHSSVTVREIGTALFLSEKTVKNYVSRILDKLGLTRRAEAAAYMAKRRPRY